MNQLKTYHRLDLNSQVIQDLINEGMTVREIEKRYNIKKYYLSKKKYNYKIGNNKNKGANEAPFCIMDRLYTWESLNLKEIKAYFKYKSKHKAYYQS